MSRLRTVICGSVYSPGYIPRRNEQGKILYAFLKNMKFRFLCMSAKFSTFRSSLRGATCSLRGKKAWLNSLDNERGKRILVDRITGSYKRNIILVVGNVLFFSQRAFVSFVVGLIQSNVILRIVVGKGISSRTFCAQPLVA